MLRQRKRMNKKLKWKKKNDMGLRYLLLRLLSIRAQVGPNMAIFWHFTPFVRPSYDFIDSKIPRCKGKQSDKFRKRERERGIERTQKWVRQMTGEHRIADLAVNFIALWTTSICFIAMPAANSSDCDCGFHTLALHSIRLIKCVYVLLNLFIFTFEYIVRKRGAGMSKRFGFAKTSSINAQISRQTAW